MAGIVRAAGVTVAVLGVGVLGLGGCGTTQPVPDSVAPVGAPEISADGRYVAYVSNREDPDPTDGTPLDDVFVWDRTAGTTTRITTSGRATQLGGLSADGRFVVWSSAPAAGGIRHVQVWDRDSGTATAITTGVGDSYAGHISADGRYVTLSSPSPDEDPTHQNPNGSADVYVWDRTTSAMSRVNDEAAANWFLIAGDISDDGRYVTYTAARESDDPIPADVHLADRTAGTIVNLTFGDNYSVDPSISGDGRYVAFHSHAPNLVPAGEIGDGADIFVWDRTTGTLSRLTTPAANRHHRIGEISPSGRFVTYYDSGAWPDQLGDAYVWDRTTGTAASLTQSAHAQAGGVSTDGDAVFAQWPADPPAPGSGEVHLRPAPS